MIQPPIPVPEVIQRRAWECAVALVEDFDDRLRPLDRMFCLAVRQDGPDLIDWRLAQSMFALFRATVAARR